MTTVPGSFTAGLAKRVHDMVARYVRRRSEEKSGISWDSFKDDRTMDPATGRTRLNVPQKYQDARTNVCESAFYALRSCRSREDFVGFFTGTLCSVPQFVPSKDYQALANTLLGTDDGWEDVKALAMLTISALQRV